MTEVSKKLVLELRKIIKNDYGKKITIAESSEIAKTLVKYFNLLAKIHHRDNGKEECNC